MHVTYDVKSDGVLSRRALRDELLSVCGFQCRVDVACDAGGGACTVALEVRDVEAGRDAVAAAVGAKGVVVFPDLSGRTPQPTPDPMYITGAPTPPGQPSHRG